MPSNEKTSEMEKMEKESYVKNSSFLSRDIEAQKSKVEPVYNSQTLKRVKQESPPKKEVTSPPVTSPPISTFKMTKTSSKEDSSPKQSKESIPKEVKKIEPVQPIQQLTKEVHKPEPLSLPAVNKEPEKATNNAKISNKIEAETNGNEIGNENTAKKNEESNGVGDKIKKFEKAAEEATAPPGRLSRASSVRGRGRSERIGSDSDLPPPPATPFRDTFELEKAPSPPKQNSFEKQPNKNPQNNVKWQKSAEFPTDEKLVKKPEPQKIIKPEFSKQPALDMTIRSPSLGAKISDQFPSHGTAFRNVASPDTSRNNTEHKELHKINDDVNTQNNFKACKFKTKEDARKYSVSKGSSYFTRGSEEIWLVKKKDIEEIEARVLDSFTRAGGNICMRSESVRPSSDSGQGVSFSHTMGRNKRQMYARSESLDPQWAGARAQTLKRQTSVACTCGHDKKPRAKSSCDTTPRPRSRSHGDDNSQAHVLDKYETLV